MDVHPIKLIYLAVRDKELMDKFVRSLEENLAERSALFRVFDLQDPMIHALKKGSLNRDEVRERGPGLWYWALGSGEEVAHPCFLQDDYTVSWCRWPTDGLDAHIMDDEFRAYGFLPIEEPGPEDFVNEC